MFPPPRPKGADSASGNGAAGAAVTLTAATSKLPGAEQRNGDGLQDIKSPLDATHVRKTSGGDFSL